MVPGLRTGLLHGVVQCCRQVTGEDLLLEVDVPVRELVVECEEEFLLGVRHPPGRAWVQCLPEHREALLRRGGADQLLCQCVTEEVHVLTMVESRRRPRRGVPVVGEDDRAIVLRLRPHHPRQTPRIDLDELTRTRPVGSDRGVHPPPGPVVPLTCDELLGAAEAPVGECRESVHRLPGLEVDQVGIRLVGPDLGVELSGGMQAGGGDAVLHLSRRPLRLRRRLLRGTPQPHPAVVVPGAHVDHLRGGVLELERRRGEVLDAGRRIVPVRVPAEAHVSALRAVEQLEDPGAAVLARGRRSCVQGSDARIVLRRCLRACGVDACPEPCLGTGEDMRTERKCLDVTGAGDHLEGTCECFRTPLLVGLVREEPFGDVPHPRRTEGRGGLVTEVGAAGGGDLRREMRRVLRGPATVHGKVTEWGNRLRATRGHVEGIGASTEELLEVRAATGISLQRGGGSDDPELRRIGGESQSVQEPTQQECHLGPRGPAEGVELVDDEGEHCGRVRGEPFLRLLEDLLLMLAHEHHVEHRVVGDEDVGRAAQEVLAVDQLIAARVAEEIELLTVPLCGDRVVLLLEIEDLLRVLGEPRRRGRRGGAESRTGVPAEPDPRPGIGGLEATHRATEPDQLVFDECVGRVQDHRSECSLPALAVTDAGGLRPRAGPPSVHGARTCPVPRLLEQPGEDREEERLRLARAGAGGDHDVGPIGSAGQGVLERLGLVVPQEDLGCRVLDVEERPSHGSDRSRIHPELPGGRLDRALARVPEDRLEELLGECVVRLGDQCASSGLDALVTQAESRLVVGEVRVLEGLLQDERCGGAGHELILR